MYQYIKVTVNGVDRPPKCSSVFELVAEEFPQMAIDKPFLDW